MLVGMEPSYESFCLDEAIAEFGSLIEAELDKVKTRSKKPEALQARRQQVLERLLADKPRFADPADLQVVKPTQRDELPEGGR